MADAPASIVLVHGAWHGAWCWDPVVGLLRDEGIEVTALDLPGHGDDPGAFTDLSGDAAHVTSALDALGTDVVLVGHSYGGAVITEAGVHPSVRRLVYLCAFALDEGESCAAAAIDETNGLSNAGRPDLADALVWHDDGTTTLEHDLAKQCFYADCDEVTARRALSRLGPQPMANLMQAPANIAWRTTPSTYVVCDDDLAVHPDLQRVMSVRCQHQVHWPTSHSPFLSRPDLVARLLADSARAGSG